MPSLISLCLTLHLRQANISFSNNPLSITTLEELPSTQTLALEKTKDAKGDFAILAKSQTLGRGRQGRDWISPPGGNLYATLATMLEPTDNLMTLGYRACLSLVEVLKPLLDPAEQNLLQIKWPNDLFIEDGKVAGILIEIQHVPSSWCLIGLGCNLVCAEQPYRALKLSQAIAPREIFVSWYNRFLEIRTLSDHEVLCGIDRLLAFRNQPVTILHYNNTKTSGKLLGLCPDGALSVRRQDGVVERIISAEISPETYYVARS